MVGVSNPQHVSARASRQVWDSTKQGWTLRAVAFFGEAKAVLRFAGCFEMLPHAAAASCFLERQLSPDFLVARFASNLGERSIIWHKPATLERLPASLWHSLSACSLQPQ